MKAKQKKPAGAAADPASSRGNWSQAIKDAMNRKKADGGWPAPDGRYGNKKKPG
jgi:hypothetical protein